MDDKSDSNYQRIEGVKGLVYIPKCRGPKKHPCEDCYHCQFCSDTRCASCLAQQNKRKKK